MAAGEGPVAAGEWWGSTRGPARARWWSRMVGRRPEVARPCAPAVGGDCGAPCAVLDGEHEHGMQEREAKLMALLVRSEGG